MGSACRLSTNVIRLSKSISKHSFAFIFALCRICLFGTFWQCKIYRVLVQKKMPRYINPVKTVRAQLEEALTLHQRLNRRERQEKMEAAVLAMGLDVQVLNRYPGELSGGMGQRVMIAIALINDPQVLIADEPTSALDARLRNQILELLVAQCEQRKMAMLLISHDLPLVAEHCHRVLVMYQGNRVDEMTASALPQATHPYTRTLWTCRPNAQTYGQPLPTLDRRQSFEKVGYGDR